MKRSESCDDLENLNTKKRKRNLTLHEIHYIQCEICHDPVYNYKQCVGYHIYCSLDCLGIIYLRSLNNIQHQTYEDDDMLID